MGIIPPYFGQSPYFRFDYTAYPFCAQDFFLRKRLGGFGKNDEKRCAKLKLAIAFCANWHYNTEE